MTLEVPINGTAAIYIRENVIFSKAHNRPELRFHVPLVFNPSANGMLSDDVELNLEGNDTAIVFHDEETDDRLSLVRPQGRPEVHVLGGELRCFSQDDDMPTEPRLLSKFEMGSYGRGVITFTEHGTGHNDVQLVISANGTMLTVHSGELMVNGIAKQLNCQREHQV